MTSLGSWITLGHPAIAEIMARAGFEWLVVDLEHSVITIHEAEELIRIIDLCGVKPYVRVTANDPNQIKRVMDAGAKGIIVPMANTAADAKKASDAMFYPPKGKRGVGLARAQGYGTQFDHYLTLHKDFDLIIQIEHIDAIKQLDNILSCSNLYGFIVGPYDLSASMHIPGQFSDPNFKNALKTIETVSKNYPSVKRGMHLVEPDTQTLKKLIHTGYDFIAYSVDIRLLDVGVRAAITALNKVPA